MLISFHFFPVIIHKSPLLSKQGFHFWHCLRAKMGSDLARCSLGAIMWRCA